MVSPARLKSVFGISENGLLKKLGLKFLDLCFGFTPSPHNEHGRTLLHNLGAYRRTFHGA
jgi:hypothetical protein